ncbi:pyridoxamine 5'-phosphate oxidase family protein [Phenylobacterium sp. 20VBR1]|uniref:Pyridoxamine 5'-phosphate oxidase family protein n=1 Tax=Phenylobacterium glaciei TaxID=2803784 RepID=A0A941D6P8_9CAUL|nr:pyridoxamine 5'-phosphate oxidase family protein [Phenylobacterium glaciei]MBR7621733.1 pyridoxamine 5'-phosphate oxidase family protein [Phenylobacterium glaciei]
MSMYHEGQRVLQDAFGSRALADRLDETLRHDAFTDRDSAFIGEQSFFFLATADADGRPDCSFKGGPPGFARVIAPDTLIFPDYDGNGMFRSLGNLTANPNVGLLFLSVGERPQRLRVNGTAQVLADDPLLAQIPGAQLLIRVTPRDIFPNCPRYIPTLSVTAPSVYAPEADKPVVEADWKAHPMFADVVPPRRV